MLLTGFREIKPNATEYNGETVTMVSTAIGKTEQGDRDDFFCLCTLKDTWVNKLC